MRKIITDIQNNIYLQEENIKLNKIKGNIENSVINVYKDKVISKWLGMGSAITESTAYNYFKLSDEKKGQLLNDLYSKAGLDYDFARISIASNDFSLNAYEYSKKKDLRDFSIERDKKYIIPMLKDIFSMKELLLIASPWSPPRFMKNNWCLFHGGKLKKKYYDLYVNYLKLFIDRYKDNGFDINYITIQNEPMAKQKWESCIFSLDEQKDFIYNYLINKIDTNVILWDHNREDIVNVTNVLYDNNPKANILGLHWYTGGYYNNIKQIHQKYPDLLIFNTEMCCGYSCYNEKEWITDAELYLKDIISCMNSGVSAYLSWNTLLDFNGGPSHKKNYVKSPIILNEEGNDYIKTPIFYYLMHISKYIKKGYKIIENNTIDEDLYVISARKNNNVIITLLNASDNNINYNIVTDKEYIKDIIKAHSIITYKK